MNRMQRVGCLAAVPRLLLGLHADPDAVIDAAALDAASLANPDGVIPYAGMGRLLRASAQATRCEHFGLLIGQATGLSALGVIGQLMQNAPTVGQAFADLVENQHRFGCGGLYYSSTHDGTEILGYAVYEQGLEGVTQTYDAAISYALGLFRELSGCKPDEVLLPRAAPGNPSPYYRHLCVPVRFDSEQAAMVFPRKLLARPVPGASPALRKELERAVAKVWAVRRPSVADWVIRVLRPRVTCASRTLEEVADEMRMHPRTLNRHLRKENTSFRALLNQLRLDVACQMLEASRMNITEIGYALNYADPATFSHAFRRLSGQTPTEWRASTQAAARRTPEMQYA